MPRVPRALAFAGALLLMVVSKGNFCTVAHASENCPASVLTYWTRFHGGDSYIPAATFDTTIVNIDGDTTRVSFDHATAHVALNAVGGVWAGVRVLERFDVSGVPVGTLVHATISLSLEGEVFNAGGVGGGDTNFTATLAGATDSVATDETIPGPCYGCTKPVATTLTLPVTITAGTPVDVAFALLYHQTPAGMGRATIAGLYGVSGLPPGVRAAECSASDVTPVRRESWGRLKAAYR